MSVCDSAKGKPDVRVQVLLGENSDEGEGEQQFQDVQQPLHVCLQVLEGSSDSLSEVLIWQSSTQHGLLLLLQENTQGFI